MLAPRDMQTFSLWPGGGDKCCPLSVAIWQRLYVSIYSTNLCYGAFVKLYLAVEVYGSEAIWLSII